MELNVGDVVPIYQDPYTKKEFEGNATLIDKLMIFHDHPASEIWLVEFENGDQEERKIFL